MNISRSRALLASLFGLEYREIPPGVNRPDIDAVLTRMGARKVGESGTPGMEICIETFRIGRATLRVCTEDEMFQSLWGPRAVIHQIVDILSNRS